MAESRKLIDVQLLPRELQELYDWLAAEQAAAAHGRTLEDAGRATAYARVMVKIRQIQKLGR